MSLGQWLFLYFIGSVVSLIILYWIIRTAISGGMKDFERWKREQG